MNKYWKYFKYIMEHKKNVFIECWKEGLYIHAFTHDLSKFSLKEFLPYANWFYGEYGLAIKDKDKNGTREWERYRECGVRFSWACEHHYKHNKHHWNYWIRREMPDKYIKQMICDWKGMSRKFGDTAQEFYYKNYDKIRLERNSRINLEFELGLLGEAIIFGMTWKDCCENWGITMEEDLKNLGYIK